MISVPDAALLPSDDASDAALEFLHHLGRKSVRVQRKRLVEVNADHLPVPGGRVFAGRGQRAASVRAGGSSAGAIPASGLMLPSPSRARFGSFRPRMPRDIAQRVAAGQVAVGSGVRHCADSYAIENDPDDSAKHKFEGNTRSRWRHLRSRTRAVVHALGGRNGGRVDCVKCYGAWTMPEQLTLLGSDGARARADCRRGSFSSVERRTAELSN